MLFPLSQTEARELFFEIYNAKNAAGLQKLVESNEFLNNPNNWIPVNNSTQNFATAQNQGSDPLIAAVEKETNQYDAVLEKLCIQHGIDPSSPEAPRSVKDAVKLFLKVDPEKWHEEDSEFVQSLAENVQIIADGDKNTPNLTYYDFGIGQEPIAFPHTFLSINKGNKATKHFLQGKYNMGGFGPLEYLGGKRYQLIASKSSLNPNSPFGFTLVRLHELSAEEEVQFRSPWYEYFAPTGVIPSFEIDSLDLGLENRSFTTGSVIKLYSYEFTDGLGGDILDKFYKELNQNMFMPPMPALLSERRYKPNRIKKNQHTKVFLGNHNRIQENLGDVEGKFQFVLQVEPYGELNVSGYVLHENVKYTEYGNNKPVILTLNGQTQGWKERSYISQELGFKYLRDSLVVNVDCSDARHNYDIFQASRDRLKNSRKMKAFWDKLTEALKSEQLLQELNLERLNKRSPKADNGGMLDKIWKSVAVSERLTGLLKKGGYGLNFQTDGNAQKKTLDDNIPNKFRRTQSVVPLSELEGSKAKKTIPLGGSGNFHFHPEDNMWQSAQEIDFQVRLISHRNPSGEEVRRPHEEGEVTPRNRRAEELFDIKKRQDGDLLKINLRAKDDAVSVGDEIVLQTELSFDDKVLSSIMEVKIGVPDVEGKRKNKKESQPITPELILVHQNENESGVSWNDYGWDEADIISINIDSSGVVRSIAVNMDAQVLQSQLLKKKHAGEEIEEIKFMFMTKMYFNALYLYVSELSTRSENDLSEPEEKVAKMVKNVYGEFLTSFNPNGALNIA